MLQSFTPFSEPAAAAPRIKALRALLAERDLAAVLVPRADEHQGEYVPACAERLRWLTGFTGSAGLAVVGRKRAALCVDGRYKVQSRSEVDPTLFDIIDLDRTKIVDWLRVTISVGGAIGFDPWLHTCNEIAQLQELSAAHGLLLKPLPRNPIDRLWGRDRPRPPTGPVIIHPQKFAGRSAADKIADVQAQLTASGHDAVVLTLPDSISWLLNIRGSDVAHNPVVLAFAIVPARGRPDLFIDTAKLDAEARQHLTQVVRLQPPADLTAGIRKLRQAGKRVRIDPATAAWAIGRQLGGKTRYAAAADPCRALKARKNSAEIKGARTAHQRDGVAMARFLCWLDATAPTGLDEITAVQKLEDIRRETGALQEISFDTIAGSGPNGAIVHYRVTEATNRRLRPGELFLLDSGGQYADGTTDITRTIAIGKPSAEMCQRFTLVLKGHIAIATARFPGGTRGIDLDPFARRALWEHGLDYDHGTGHGIGSYLSVHEGPQSISRNGMAMLEPGMLCSNEPGYYKTGAYGIRIENVVLVSEAATPKNGDKPVMSFDTLTLAPIDLRLVDKSLMTQAEIAWLDDYHATVRDTLAPKLDDVTRAWLAAATRPLANS